MTHLITRKPEDDDEVAGWMAQAGDPRVEPRPEHVEHVREVLFERLAVTAPWASPPLAHPWPRHGSSRPSCSR